MDCVKVSLSEDCQVSKKSEVMPLHCCVSTSVSKHNERSKNLREQLRDFLSTQRILLDYQAAFRTNHTYYLIERISRQPSVL
jgi:hypothetical protein